MAADGRPPPAEARQALVVGCGPAGSLVAIYLARLGWRVSVYEKRSDYPTRVAAGGIDQRAYDIFLGPRGLEAIQQAGAELAAGVGVVVEGMASHMGAGKIPKLKLPAPLTAINRDALTDALQQHGARAFPRLIDYNFDHKFVGADLDGKMATFEKVRGGEAVTRRYDLMVGADGVWSGVRGEMARAGLVTVRQERNAGWNRVMGVVDGLPGAQEDWGRYWHLWVGHSPGLLITGSPTPCGRYRLTLGVLTDEASAQIWNPKSGQRLEDVVRAKYPDVLGGGRLPEGLGRAFSEQEANHNGVETICSAFHGGDGVVLVGDAAHSVWPNQAQGCNAALESCKVLAGVLVGHGGDLSKALPAFTAVRKPETDAAAAFSRRPFFTVWGLLRAQLLVGLHSLLPCLFSESPRAKVIRGELSYSDAQRLERRQNWQLGILLAGLAGLAVVALKKK